MAAVSDAFCTTLQVATEQHDCWTDAAQQIGTSNSCRQTPLTLNSTVSDGQTFKRAQRETGYLSNKQEDKRKKSA